MAYVAKGFVDKNNEIKQKRNARHLNDVSTVTELMLLEVGSEDPSDEFTYTHENLTATRCYEGGVPKLFLESQSGPRDN